MSYKDKLKNLDVTVKFLANKIGVSQTMMSYYINGTRPFPDGMKVRVDNILKAIERIA